MTRLFFAQCLALCFLAFAGSSKTNAQHPCEFTGFRPGEYIPPRVGTVITYTGTYSETDEAGETKTADPLTASISIKRAENDMVEYFTPPPESIPTRTVTFRGLVTVESDAGELRRNKAVWNNVRGLWPLKAGNRARLSIEMQFLSEIERESGEFKPSGTSDVEFLVKNAERVVTPAGTFDTFVIERIERVFDRDGKPTRTVQLRYAFAPSLGWFVRVEGEGVFAKHKTRTVTVANEIRCN